MSEDGKNETTFAEKVRQAALQVKEFGAAELADLMKVQTYTEREGVRSCIKDFIRRGEMERVGRGRYRYVQRHKKVTARQRIWNAVRRMPGPYFDLDDIEQLTGINREAIKDFCGYLVREGYTDRVKNGHFKRVKDFGVAVPVDRQKIERLKGIREKRNGTRIRTD